MRKSNVTVILSILFFTYCSNTHSNDQVMPPGEYTFACATGLIDGDTTSHGWIKINQFKDRQVIYQVRNDTLVEVGNKNMAAAKKILARVIQFPDSSAYQRLPKRYLDFELQGVYHEKGHPFDFYSILYYSKQRHALMRQYHGGLNKINVVALYFPNTTDTVNPFKNYSRFFKLESLDFHETGTIKIGEPQKK